MVTSTLGASKVVFWVMILISQAHGFVGALPYVPLMVMWGKFTPKSEMLANAEMWRFCSVFNDLTPKPWKK